jgi:preprotein translocase subunit SecA
VFEQIKDTIDTAMIESFNKLSVKDGHIDFENSGLRVPSSTWTYLVNDDPFERNFGMLLVSNIAVNAFAGLLWPLTFLLFLLRKLKKQRI